jgi:molybdate transport system ATP-binding protein
LLGPNGSGKTTLLSLILGDHPQAYANDTTVFDRRRGTGETIWDIKHYIGWVSPELHLHFTRSATCLEVVASGFHDTIGLFHPLTRRQRSQARFQLADFGLLPYADIPLYGLSAGTQRMALLARALVKRPRLLILDEPCQGLDSARRTAFIQTVDRLILSRTVTVLYVTHRPDELPRSIRKVLRLP